MKLHHGLAYPDTYEFMPWEPVIGQAGYGFTQGVWTPDQDNMCEECRRGLPENFTQLISTGENAFCSWECLQKRVEKFPGFYTVIETV